MIPMENAFVKNGKTPFYAACNVFDEGEWKYKEASCRVETRLCEATFFAAFHPIAINTLAPT